MGSTNFRNFGDPLPGEGNAYKLNADSNRLLSRQPSVYSLTFDEFQNTWGGLGKDFGSMNMDELLKNIWNAEESQAMGSSGVGGGAAGEANLVSGNLQRQGSLTLPRTLSQKTVDEVWKDLFKETTGAKDGTGGEDLQSLPQRQRTLGEMTLEEFLARVGVVREEPQQMGSLNNSTFYGDLSSLNNNNSSAGLALGFQQQGQSNPLVLDQFAGSNKFNSSQPPSLASDAAGTKSSPQQPRSQPVLQPRPPQPFTKPAVTLAFTSPLHLSDSAQLASPGSNGKVGILDHYVNFSTVRVGGTQNGGIGGANFGSRAMVVPVGSPTNQMSPNLIPKGSMDSVSPVPYPLGRGRKPTGSLEKVVERRQRRMIKNRESAARSRARKQAYTLELEAEVAKLKELNEELQRKQEEFMEMQKDQVLQTVNGHWGSKRLYLRRTLTGPW